MGKSLLTIPISLSDLSHLSQLVDMARSSPTWRFHCGFHTPISERNGPFILSTEAQTPDAGKIFGSGLSARGLRLPFTHIYVNGERMEAEAHQ